MNRNNQMEQPSVRDVINRSFHTQTDDGMICVNVISAIRDLRQVYWLYVKTTLDSKPQNVQWLEYNEFMDWFKEWNYKACSESHLIN